MFGTPQLYIVPPHENQRFNNSDVVEVTHPVTKKNVPSPLVEKIIEIVNVENRALALMHFFDADEYNLFSVPRLDSHADPVLYNRTSIRYLELQKLGIITKLKRRTQREWGCDTDLVTYMFNPVYTDSTYTVHRRYAQIK